MHQKNLLSTINLKEDAAKVANLHQGCSTEDWLPDMPMRYRGIIVEIYTSNFKKTPIGEKSKEALLVGTGIPPLSGVSSELPLLILKKLFDGTKIATPYSMKNTRCGFGGTFIWLNHKRFPSNSPIRVMDVVL